MFSDAWNHEKFAFSMTIVNPIQLIHKANFIKLESVCAVENFTATKETTKKV